MSQFKSIISISCLMALICSISSSALAMPTATICAVGPVILDAHLDANRVSTPAVLETEILELDVVLDNVWAGDSGSENRIADAADARLLLWHDAKRLDAVTRIA